MKFRSLILLLLVNISPRNGDSDIDTYCREKERLITSEENDEYLLVSVQTNAAVKLKCQFCNDNEDHHLKIWYYQDPFQINPEEEVELEMHNNISYNRVYRSLDLSLIITNFDKLDAGIYRCHIKEHQEEQYKFNYKLEPVSKDHGEISTEQGNMSKWEEYNQMNLKSVTTRFAISSMPDIAKIREAGIILSVITEWGPWSPCENCVNHRGTRTRRGECRLKRQFANNTTTMLIDKQKIIVDFFNNTPKIPCKSLVLQDDFPTISNAIATLPEFILEEGCKNCTKTKKTKKKEKRFKYKRRRVLAEGSHLTVACPESSLETKVIWKKDSITLKRGGSGTPSDKKGVENRVIVDAFSTLYMIDATEEESGNYTCYVDGINMLQLRVTVITKSIIMTQAFLRHVEYLGVILLLTLFCYCGGLVMACKRRNTFKIRHLRDIDRNKEKATTEAQKGDEESAPMIPPTNN